MDETVGPAGDWMELAPWRDRSVLLMREQRDGTWSQAWTIDAKRALLDASDGGLVFAVWSGKWHATSRWFTYDDMKAVRALL